MRVVLATSIVSQAQSAKLALDAEEIPAVINNALMAPFQHITVSVRDEDFVRARRVLEDLDLT